MLLTVIGPPLRGWPTSEQLRAWLQQPLTEETLTAGLAIGAWLIWLLVAYTVTARIIIRLRATTAWLRRMPLPTPLQATASGMAGAAVFGITTNTVTTTPPQPPQPAATGTTTFHDDTAPDDQPDQAVRDDGVTVAGGWLPRDVAEQVTAAAALVWLRRRRDYQPHPTHPDDTDLTPLPTTVTAVQAALADTPTPPPSDGIAAPFEALPTGGVGLTGPGTLPVGRGLLVTAILAGQRRSSTSLIVTKATLALLLGPAAETLGRRLPLTIVDTADDAAQLLRPASPVTGEAIPGQRQGETSSGHGHRKMVLLNGHDGSEQQMKHLAETGTATAALVVVLGEQPDGPNWHATSTGHLHDPHRPDMPSPRLCVLDQTAATDLLSVIARPEPPKPQPAAEPSSFPYARSPELPLPRQVDRTRPQRLPSTPQQRLHLRILGDPQLLIDNAPLAVRRSASLQVLVYLALHSKGANTAQLTDAMAGATPKLPHRPPLHRPQQPPQHHSDRK
ncbi:hypothetical protein ACN267_12985 [Micromonospora sp. WMMD734]|uniref:hypothetical protein n=1 Tax=Micromonospora sp. WMMD734 TaxID=3404129 RepID=UPI003B9387A0